MQKLQEVRLQWNTEEYIFDLFIWMYFDVV